MDRVCGLMGRSSNCMVCCCTACACCIPWHTTVVYHVPHQATLEEVVSADVLLHVVDASARDAATQRHAVLQVLRQLGLSEHNLHTRVIEVWNKMDAVGNAMDAVGGHNAEEVVQVGDALQGGCTVEVVEKQGGAQQGGDRLHVVKPWLDNDGQHDRGEHEEDHTSHPWSTHDGLTRVAISVKTQLNIDQLLTAIDDKVGLDA